ncbi:ankyrin repeat domain-containing protein [Spirosoma areae]
MPPLKLVTITNWSLLIMYGVILAYSALTMTPSNTDAAGRGLATAYILVGAILLVLLMGVNVLPFRLTRIAVLMVALLPLVAGLFRLASQFRTTQRTTEEDTGRLDGSYYFHDRVRQELAQAIANQDLTTFQTALQQPIPQLNESGEDHMTLLDFAAMRAVYSDSSGGAIPFLTALLAKGATVETNDTLRSPTHALVSRDCSATLLAWFLKNGANPNANRLQEYPTPILFTVMEYDHDRLAKLHLLLNNGADPNAVYPPAASGWLAGHSALLAAARQELWAVCLLLLEKGADTTVASPQKLRFTDLITRQAELYAERNETPATFTALLKTMNVPNGHRHD